MLMLSEHDNQLHHVPRTIRDIMIIINLALEFISCSSANFYSMFRFNFDIDDPIDDPDTGVIQDLRTNQQENSDDVQSLPEAQFREISIDDLVRLLRPSIV